MTYSLIDRLADLGTPTAEEAIAEIARLRAERRMLVSHATMGNTDGEGLSVNQISCEITALRNRLHDQMTDRIAAKDALIRELTDAGNNCRAFTALFSGSDQAMKLAVDDWDAAITRAKDLGYE